MTHEKLVAGTESPTRYTKIIRNPGAGTKYNRTYQETDYISRYTKTVAGGKDYVPPAPPEPEYEQLAIADGQGSNWVGTNVYEVGQTVEGKTAKFTGGLEPITYRYRFQFKAAGTDTWVNSSWTTTTNAKNSVTYELTEAGQIKLQSQARDSQDPVVQLNSITGIKTVVEPAPPTSIGHLSLTIDDVAHTYGEVIYCAVNQSLRFHMSNVGDATPSFKWEARSNYPVSISEQAASTILTFPEMGSVTLTCTVSDGNATDSPLTYAMSVYVATEAEWDLLHPTTTN